MCRGTVDTQELQSVALFEKCRQFTKARELQAVGLYPYFNPISESEDTVVVIDGQKRIMLGSNNYLGLTHHTKVLEAATRLVALLHGPEVAAPLERFFAELTARMHAQRGSLPPDQR